MDYIVIYTDFDGTITAIPGIDAVNISLEDQKKTISSFEQKFGKYNDSFDYNQSDSNLLMTSEAVSFFHDMLQRNDVKINIVTKDRTDYIKALFAYQGFSEQEINKLNIIDTGLEFDSVSNNLKKYRNNNLPAHIYIFDDNIGDYKATYKAVRDSGYPGEQIHGYNNNPGTFGWNKYKKEIIELCVSKNTSIKEEAGTPDFKKLSSSDNAKRIISIKQNKYNLNKSIIIGQLYFFNKPELYDFYKATKNLFFEMDQLLALKLNNDFIYDISEKSMYIVSILSNILLDSITLSEDVVKNFIESTEKLKTIANELKKQQLDESLALRSALLNFYELSIAKTNTNEAFIEYNRSTVQANIPNTLEIQANIDQTFTKNNILKFDNQLDSINNSNNELYKAGKVLATGLKALNLKEQDNTILVSLDKMLEPAIKAISILVTDNGKKTYTAAEREQLKSSIVTLASFSEFFAGQPNPRLQKIGTALLAFAFLAAVVIGVLAAVPTGGTSLLLTGIGAAGLSTTALAVAGGSAIAATAITGAVLLDQGSRAGLNKDYYSFYKAVSKAEAALEIEPIANTVNPN